MTVLKYRQLKKTKLIQYPAGNKSESYIIQYTYIKWNSEYHILYFWQGRKCPILDKGASAKLTVDFHRRLKTEAKEIRIVQNTETDHFLSIFDYMIIRLGKDPNSREDSLS